MTLHVAAVHQGLGHSRLDRLFGLAHWTVLLREVLGMRLHSLHAVSLASHHHLLLAPTPLTRLGFGLGHRVLSSLDGPLAGEGGLLLVESHLLLLRDHLGNFPNLTIVGLVVSVVRLGHVVLGKAAWQGLLAVARDLVLSDDLLHLHLGGLANGPR